jgi:hypothetical protein
MDSSLHVSSHLYTSGLLVMEQVQTESVRLKVENFFKEYVSLIWLLLTIFTAALERILATNCAFYCALAAATEIQITLAQMDFLDYLLNDAYSNHVTATEHQKGLASLMGMLGTEPSKSTWLLIQGTEWKQMSA